MEKLINKLVIKYPHLQFEPGRQFSWSPELDVITYKQAAHGQKATWSLLHESGHALLGHDTYSTDFSLLKLELEAWEKAKQIATELGQSIDEDHIQDCLDTYRDWLYKRSICPTCTTKCLQQDDCRHYRCFNCHTTWRVSASRFCRAYRSTKNVPQSTVVI